MSDVNFQATENNSYYSKMSNRLFKPFIDFKCLV